MEVPQSLGHLQRIHIGHDNSGFGSAWFLDKVVIEDEHTGKQYTFYGQRWLDKSKGAIECDLLLKEAVADSHSKTSSPVRETAPELNANAQLRGSSPNLGRAAADQPHPQVLIT
jgi:hypothetical protein